MYHSQWSGPCIGQSGAGTARNQRGSGAAGSQLSSRKLARVGGSGWGSKAGLLHRRLNPLVLGDNFMHPGRKTARNLRGGAASIYSREKQKQAASNFFVLRWVEG
jgi:hypothetical protein